MDNKLFEVECMFVMTLRRMMRTLLIFFWLEGNPEFVKICV